jgi:selenocysteine lyase/cysteine desulfurase
VKRLDLSPTARRFEAGSPPVPNVYGAMKGIALLQEIGLGNVAAHIGSLVQELLAGARRLDIQSKTPADSTGPLVVLQCRDAAALVEKLGANNIVCSSRHDGLRLSFHVYNTSDDVAAVLRLLEQNLDMLVTGPETVGAKR